METATNARLQLDIKRNRARQYATMIVMEMQAHIPESSRREAIYDLANMFEKADVEITTAEDRKITAAHLLTAEEFAPLRPVAKAA